MADNLKSTRLFLYKLGSKAFKGGIENFLAPGRTNGQKGKKTTQVKQVDNDDEKSAAILE